MAAGEITGGTHQELAEMQFQHKSTPLAEAGVPFERAYCLTRIGKQPEEYDGPERFCTKRAPKLDREEWEAHYDDPFPETRNYESFDERAYCHTCRFHGRKISGHEDTLDSYTAAITHGLHAEDEHLQMDFTDAEQTLYDGIVEQWPEAYDWPEETEDPARYLMLRKTATNVVRSERAEDYIDDEGEVRITDRISDEGIVVEPDGQHDENPIAGEYRLLWREITNNLKEMGVTPRAQSKMGAQEQAANSLEDIGNAVSQAVLGDEDDHEYDPNRFEETNDDGDAT